MKQRIYLNIFLKLTNIGLLYNPDVTLFMKKSAENGAVVKNGLEMLLLQAFESWEIWTDRR